MFYQTFGLQSDRILTLASKAQLHEDRHVVRLIHKNKTIMRDIGGDTGQDKCQAMLLNFK